MLQPRPDPPAPVRKAVIRAEIVLLHIEPVGLVEAAGVCPHLAARVAHQPAQQPARAIIARRCGEAGAQGCGGAVGAAEPLLRLGGDGDGLHRVGGRFGQARENRQRRALPPAPALHPREAQQRALVGRVARQQRAIPRLGLRLAVVP